MNCAQISFVLQNIPFVQIPKDIALYVAVLYSARSAPLVAVSQTAVVALFRGNLSIWVSAHGLSWEDLKSHKDLLVRYSLPPVHDNFGAFGETKLAQRMCYINARWRDATLIACANRFVVMVIDNKVYEHPFSHIREAQQSGFLVPAEHTKLIEMPLIGTIVSLSCGSEHSAITIQIPDANKQLVLWGDNTSGQLARTDRASHKPRWAARGNMLEVICMGSLTIILVDGQIMYSGAYCGSRGSECFVRVNMTAIPGRFISMNVIRRHVNFMTDDGTAYTSVNTDPSCKIGFVWFAAHITGSRIHTLGTVQHTEGILHLYPHALVLDIVSSGVIHICNWTDIGGL
jgi:hypothetical protein